MKALFIGLGFIFFGLGVLGAVLPVLPATPFLLLASGCFAKGSVTFTNWFKRTSLYKEYLQGYIKNKPMARKSKISVLSFLTLTIGISFIVVNSLIVRVILVLVWSVHFLYFKFKIPTLNQ